MVQWVFGCCEGDLDDLYWRYSFPELKTRIKLHVGHATATQMAQYSSLVSVLAAAFGDGKKSAPTEDLSQLAPEDFVARIGQIGAL